MRSHWKPKGLFLASIAVALAVVSCAAPASPTPAAQPTQPQATAAPAASPSATRPEATKLKVAFVYVGPVGDAGWTLAHDNGRKFLEKNVPNVETTYLENVPEAPADAERVFTELAQKGYQVIFGTSFGYMDPMLPSFPMWSSSTALATRQRPIWGLTLAKSRSPDTCLA
jgi:basic membrane protein A